MLEDFDEDQIQMSEELIEQKNSPQKKNFWDELKLFIKNGKKTSKKNATDPSMSQNDTTEEDNKNRTNGHGGQ